MIKRLQKRFVAIAMLSFILVLLLVGGSINLAVGAGYTRQADDIIRRINEEGVIIVGDYAPRTGTVLWDLRLTKDTPLIQRYFVAHADEEGNITHVNTDHTLLVEEEEAALYASEMLAQGTKRGYLDKYRFHVTQMEDGYLITALDCIRQLDSTTVLATNTFLVVVCSLIIVHFLLKHFATRVTAPMAANLKRQKQFITDAGHEIKTPLAIISANNEILQLEHGESQWTESITNQVERLDTLVGQLLQLSNMKAPLEENVELVYLSQLLNQCLQEFQPLFEKKGLELQTHIEGDIGLTGRREDLRCLLDLLLDNMVSYAPSGGLARVELWGDSKTLKFINPVEEELPEDLNLLFQRFYRVENSRSRQTGGNGIGLAVATSIVEELGGRISAKNNEELLEISIVFP